MVKFLLLLLLVVLVVKGSHASAVCPHCTTLEELYSHMRSMMPTSGSELYVAPSATVVADFELIVAQMMAGASYDGITEGTRDCSSIDLRSLTGLYAIDEFTDADNGVVYCALVTQSLASPWSNVVVNQNVGAKALSIDAAHPRFDSHTGEQCMAVFKGTHARSTVIAGSHRHANAAPSPCDGSGYHDSDAAHNTHHCFQSATKAILDTYETTTDDDYTVIQFHGMGQSSCPGVDAYVTHGTSVVPRAGEKVDIFRNAMAHVMNDNGLVFTVPGDSPSCNLVGSTNVQGRMINGVDSLESCTTKATSYSGRFLHVESKIDLRAKTPAMHGAWVNVVNTAYDDFVVGPVTPPQNIVVTAPNGGETIGQGTIVTVQWEPLPSDNPQEQLQISVGTKINGVYTYVQGIAYGTSSWPYAVNSAGSYDWRVRTSLPEGDSYVVRIRSVDETQILDYSDTTLSVVKPFAMTYPTLGLTLFKGQTYTLQWQVRAPGVDTVKLSLHKGTSFYKNIAVTTTNDGSYEWTVPNYVENRNDYTIRIRNTDYTSSKDYSETFSIAA